MKRKLKVLGISYEVQLVDPKKLNGDWGECDLERCIIKINRDLPKDRQQAVLLHEILHIAFSHSNVRVSPSLEERIIEGIDDVLFSALSDNGLLR